MSCLIETKHDSGPVQVWGLPLAPWTFPQTLAEIGRLIDRGEPGYFITANLHYAMLSARQPRLVTVNRNAHFLAADGMPLVWASRWRRRHVPERVTGADLVPAMCQLAAERGYRVFLLGGTPGVNQRAAEALQKRFPELAIVGLESPPFRELTPTENAALVARIRAARPDILLIAFGQPRGELWIADHYRALGVPVCVQIGASLDFLAGKVGRAPHWLQKIGFEWAYRLLREPRRLSKRYAANALFAAWMLLRDGWTPRDRRA
jgi:N-acetylglucosaminyldiphosphoundecaprenol N-acetyl-beta-D-mannosaminyltransferase